MVFLFNPSVAFADLKFGSFYPQGKPDWFEIINEEDTQINFSSYSVKDLAGNTVTKDISIPAKGNCIFEFQNRLNNGGDVLFLYKNDQQIDCFKYGDTEPSECQSVKDPPIEESRPSSLCYEPTPEPTQTPTPKPTSTPKPQTPKPTITPSPKPTVILTPKPTEIVTMNPLESPTPEVLSLSTQVSDATPTPEEEVITIDDTNPKKYFIGSLAIGLLLICGSIAFIVKKEYNGRYHSIVEKDHLP